MAGWARIQKLRHLLLPPFSPKHALLGISFCLLGCMLAHPSAENGTTPKAPAQVAMPAPPPMKYVPGMAEALVATGPVGAAESADLDAALKAFHDAPAMAGPGGDYDDYAKPLLGFIAAHPQSNWNAGLNLNIGLGYYHAGYYSRVFTYLDKAWQLGRNATSTQAHIMIDRAVGELARMHARIGHDKELEALFADIGKRPIGGPATELIQGAREGLWAFHHRPEIAYLCGPAALRNVLISLKMDKKQISVAEHARSTAHGFTLTELANLADKAKLKYQLIYRKAGQPVPVPSIINWNVHHYAAIMSEKNGLYQIIDPTFSGYGGTLITTKAINAEGSGYFLVPTSTVKENGKAGWRILKANSDEARNVYGMGDTGDSLAGATMKTDKMLSSCGGDAPQIVPSVSSCASNNAMTTADAHTMVVSLNLSDTPVGYKPQVGLPALTKLVYNSRESEQPANQGFSNVSSKWTFGWLGYIQDNPLYAGLSVKRVDPSGGGIDYTVGSYNQTTGSFTAETYDNAQLFRFPSTGDATRYERHLPDGSIEVYALSNGAMTYPRLLFLTQIVDPAGNTTTLNYDSQFRITSIVDAMGRNTTFAYTLPGYSRIVTKVTDPFGRFTQLNYDGMQRLSSITDPIGITSTFTYSPTETTFITNLQTPYGTSTFSDTPPSNDTVETNTRSLTLKDPLGFTDFLYFYENPTIVNDTAPPPGDPYDIPPSPSKQTVYNGLLEWRNTFYWNKHAFAQGVTVDGSGNITAEDFTKSRITHWVHNQPIAPAVTGRAAESIRYPLQNRIWYNYTLQPTPYENGTIDKPEAIGQTLDDGSTQVSYASYWYLGLGNLWFTDDPLSRETVFGIDTNNIDILNIYQELGSLYYTIATFSNYNSQHEAQTYMGADGQTWNYTYKPTGQLSTITDPNGGVTTYNYDVQNRLSNIVNANHVTALTLTYDSFDRVHTRTDSEGYALTYAYDALDRVTTVTYPDGTTDLYNYNFQSGPLMGTPSLDLRKHTDRLGRITTYNYDADRRLTSVVEPVSTGMTRTTQYHYYEDGTLKDITDAKGNVTHWQIDVQSRPTSKTYGYGTVAAQTETYAYEITTSRLHSVTDALGQIRTFAYGLDNRITGITYTNTVNPTPNVSFTWDPVFPRITSMTDGLGTTNYSYVPVGTNGALNLSSIDGPFANNDTISLTYDNLGRLATRTISGGNETFGYDPIGRLNTHTTPLGTFTYGYLGQTNQVTSRKLGTNTLTSWGYDTNVNDRRLISIANTGVSRSYTLSYLSGGTQNPYDIQSITDTAATGHPWATQTHTYGYDQSDRLLTATQAAPGNYTYAYDKLDNATSVTTPSGTVTPTYNGFNQLKTYGASSYAYDLDGNTLSGDGTRSYKWDAENRLVEIDYASGAKSNFSYDGMGHRMVDVETAVGGATTTTRYLWCGASICQTRNGSDTVLRRDTDEGEYTPAPTQKFLYLPDQLGSTRDVVSATGGALVDSFDYGPYGNIVRSNGTAPIDYRYAGLFYHPQSGLNLAAMRQQDTGTSMGRWLNRDVVREGGGVNLYSYAAANPTNYLDPLGLYTLQIGGAFNFNFLGIHITAGGGFAIDTEGYIGSFNYEGGGIGLGQGASLGVTILASTAPTICDLNGPFAHQGGDIALGLGSTIDSFEGVDRQNKPVAGIGGGVSAGAGVSAYGGVTNTVVIPLARVW